MKTRTWTATVEFDGITFDVEDLYELEDPNVPGFGFRVKDTLAATKDEAARFLVNNLGDNFTELTDAYIHMYKTTKARGRELDRSFNIYRDGDSFRII